LLRVSEITESSKSEIIHSNTVYQVYSRVYIAVLGRSAVTKKTRHLQ